MVGNVLTLLLVMLLATGCKKDTANPTGLQSNSYVGAWNIHSLKIDSSFVDPNVTLDVLVKVILNSDSSGQTLWTDNGTASGSETVRWSIAGDSLKLFVGGSSPYTYSFWCSLNSNTMNLKTAKIMIGLPPHFQLWEYTYRK